MTTPLSIPPPRRKLDAQSRNNMNISPTSSIFSASSSNTHPHISSSSPLCTSPSPSSSYNDSRLGHERRPSLLIYDNVVEKIRKGTGSSLSRQEHTVINVGHPDGPPRLITCVRSSQGFDWNQEIFLPDHIQHLSSSPELERKRDPVVDILLSEEEVERLFPS